MGVWARQQNTRQHQIIMSQNMFRQQTINIGGPVDQRNQTTCVTTLNAFKSCNESSSWISSMSSSSSTATPNGSSPSPFFSSFTKSNSCGSDNNNIRDYNVWMPQSL